MEEQLELQLKVTTVRKAVLKAYNQMPDRFGALTLCLTVRSILNRMTMDGTILRRLRELRDDKTLDYIVIDKVNSIYQKITGDE